MLQQSKSVFVIKNMIKKTLITNGEYNPPFFQRHNISNFTSKSLCNAYGCGVL